MSHYHYPTLLAFAETVFLQMGVEPAHAKTAAQNLLSADLRGVDSHGVARLEGYVRLWEKGRINAKAEFKVVHESPSTAVIDADAGLGLAVGSVAMQLAMDKANTCGTGWVAVRNSNHFGIAGQYAMMAAEKGMIGIATTNASPLVSPTFGAQRMLGTNPFAFAIPAATEPTFVADFATTTAANGKLEMLERKNEPAPNGWIQTASGESSTDPKAVKAGGSLLPLGGDRLHGSHKGYSLGAVADILSGVLSGANYGPWVPPFVAFLNPLPDLPGLGLGHFFGAMRTDAFRPAEEFLAHMDKWIIAMRGTRPIDPAQPVQIPGDYERKCTAERMEKGIYLLPEIESSLDVLAQKFSISGLQKSEA
ncbi:MAG: Ldh family oxidoreductase [Bacteroidota bacterium]